KQGFGGAQPNINQGVIYNLSFPLSPLPEQQRIVSAIEERFTILDAVTTALQQNKQKLKLARASVLKHAVEGKLTEKWRAEHPATESGSELLERILAERRAKWEAEQLAKGKDPKKLRYEEPAGPDVSKLLELPEGWFWTNIGQIAWSVKDGPHYSPKYVEDGIPFITGGNIKPTGVDFDSAKRISLELHLELSKRCKPEKGDILYTKGGTTGIARVNTYDIDFNVWVHVAVLKLVNSINVFYIQNTLNSQLCYVQAQKFTHGVGNQDLGLTRMIHIMLPFPPLAEQQQIVAEIERRLSVIEQAEVAIEASLKHIERARQSILEMAFSGRLVPQDPNDEPASVLLERIQEERGKRLAEGKLRGKNGGVKAGRARKTKEQDFVPQWQLLRDTQPSGLVDGSLSNAGAHEDGAAEKGEVGPDKVDKEELGDLVQMPLLLWD
ncbi:MAG TPA: restriction endonuclease subunit S, partial [Ktedonobacteraceae bacterium]